MLERRQSSIGSSGAVNAKVVGRFGYAEEVLAAEGRAVADASLEEMEAI